MRVQSRGLRVYELDPRLKPGQCFGRAPVAQGWNYFTEMCSGSEAGWYLRLIDFVYHSTLGLRVIKKKKKVESGRGRRDASGFRVQGLKLVCSGVGGRVQGLGFRI